MKKLEKRVQNFAEYLLEDYYNWEIVESRRKYLIAEARQFSNPTERAVISIATDAFLCRVNLTNAVIESVLKKLDDTDRKLICLLYFRKSHTVSGAGTEVGLSKSVAYEHRNAVIRAIALGLGYIAA